MSPKELNYVEDALGHVKHLHLKCCELSSQVKDQEISSFCQGMAAKHSEIFGEFYNLLQG